MDIRTVWGANRTFIREQFIQQIERKREERIQKKIKD